MGFYRGPKTITSGLILYLDAANTKSYNATTTWYDQSSSLKNATLLNSVGYNSNNKGSLVFDGANTYGTTPSLGTLTSYSISTWFYCVSDAHTSWNIFTEVFDGVAVQFILGHGNDTNNLQVGFYRSGTWNLLSTPMILNRWVNITYTVGGGTLTLYIDGVYNSSTSCGTPLSSGGLCRIGRRWDLNDIFNGRISLLQVYNKVLTSTEVTQNYNATKNRFI